MDRMSEFEPQTVISDEGFAEIEEATVGESRLKFRLDPERRVSILERLQQFEFFRTYERSEAGARRWRKFRKIVDDIDAIIRAAKVEESLPGHLWSFVTERADVHADYEIDRLEKVRDQIRALETEVTAAKKKGSDYFLAELLFGLEREFLAAGGKKTGVSNGDGRRGGAFVRFCDATITHLPVSCRPPRSVGSRWEILFRGRRNGTRPPKRTWVGKAHPFLKHY